MTSIASEKMENQEKFNKLDYEFRLFHSLQFGEVKLSPECIAFLTFPDKKLFILDDKEKCSKIFDDFLKFIKTAHRDKHFKKKGLASGVITEVEWAKKFKYWLKKKPCADQTKDYLIDVFNQCGLLDREIK